MSQPFRSPVPTPGGAPPANAEERRARYNQMREEIRQLQASVTSANGGVTVVAGPSGSIREVRLTDQALRTDATSLSRTITQTLQRAAAQAARQMAEIVERYAGDRMGLADRVNKLQEEILRQEPHTTEGFVPHRNDPADENSVLSSGWEPARHPAPAAPPVPQPLVPQPPVAHPQPPRPTPAPAQAPAPRRQRFDDVDDDEGGFSVLRDGW